ncbi:MAG: hypothetical protein WC852_05225 [Candidatus Nanoarchaeia archaeon]|jgi:hypothetical protein
MKKNTQNLLMITLNIILIGAIGVTAFKGGVNLTGFAVAGNQSNLLAYKAYLNITDTETGETSNFLFNGKTIFFVNHSIADYDEAKLKLIDTKNVYSDNPACKSFMFLQKKYFYDENLNAKYDNGEQYLYSVETDEEGCLVAEIPNGYKAVLAL